MSAEPWQRYEVPGPVKAVPIVKPEMVSALIKRAKKPIFLVGHEAVKIDLNGKKPIDYIIRMAKATDIAVVATANTAEAFLERNFTSVTSMSAMEVGNRLTDSQWDISGGNTPHDLALILGLPYYMGFVIESGLKSFAYSHLKTISLDQYYQPHCNWSFPNISVEEWDKNLNIIAIEVEKK